MYYESQVHENRCYNYRKKSSRLMANGEHNNYWLCIDCEKLKDQNGREENESYSVITVCNNLILKNPDVGHHSQCVGRVNADVEAKLLDREARPSCKNGLKRPLEAHTDMHSEVVKRFRQADTLGAVETQLPEYKSILLSVLLSAIFCICFNPCTTEIKFV